MLVFGLPIAKTLMDSENLAVFTVALIAILPLQNIGSILAKQIFGKERKDINWGYTIKSSLLDPNMIGMYIGLSFYCQSTCLAVLLGALKAYPTLQVH